MFINDHSFLKAMVISKFNSQFTGQTLLMEEFSDESWNNDSNIREDSIYESKIELIGVLCKSRLGYIPLKFD